MSGVRVAVIGLGTISQAVHLPLLRRGRDLDLVALVDLSPSRVATLATRYGVPQEGCFTSLEALLQAVRESRLALDAAIVATPGGHVTEALALIRAGIRVLAEKPLGWCVEDLDELALALKALGRDPVDWLRVGYMKEHDPAVAEAAKLLTDVTVREVRVEVLHPADANQLRFANLLPAVDDVDREALEAATTFDQRSITRAVGQAPEPLRRLWSNVVLGSVIHDIALTRHLGLGLARVESVRRAGDSFPGSITGLGTTAGGVPWTLSWHFIAAYPEYRETVTIHHEGGTISLRFPTPYIANSPTVLQTHTAEPGLGSLRTRHTWPQDEAFERELAALGNLCRGAHASGSGLAEARADLVSAAALWRACAAQPPQAHPHHSKGTP